MGFGGESIVASACVFALQTGRRSFKSSRKRCSSLCCSARIPTSWTLINHLMYADDLVILAPSVSGLSKLLSICEIFGECNDIIFNQKKSASTFLKC